MLLTLVPLLEMKQNSNKLSVVIGYVSVSGCGGVQLKVHLRAQGRMKGQPLTISPSSKFMQSVDQWGLNKCTENKQKKLINKINPEKVKF